MATVNFNQAQFEATIDKGIVFIDWWASWCAPCRAFAPVYESAAKRHSDVTFAKINTEEEPGLAGAFGIRSIPTLMIFRDGVLLFEQPGMLPAQALDSLVEQVKALDMNKVRAELEAQEKEQEAAQAAGADDH